MEKLIVTAELYDKYSAKFLDLKVGDELPNEIIDLEVKETEQEKAMEDKRLAEEKQKQDDEAAAEQKRLDDEVAAVEATSVTKDLIYRGLKVISNGTRTVEERTFHHIKCEDGTSYDLSEEDYLKEVK